MTVPARIIQSRLFHAVFLLLCGLFLSFPSLSFAQTLNKPSSNEEFYQAVEADVPNNFSTYAQGMFFGTMTAILCQLTGVDIANPSHGCLVFNPQTQKLGYSPQQNSVQVGGLLGVSTSLLGTMYTTPASSTQYVNYLADNFGVAKKTQAQEADEAEDPDARTGFQGISSVLQLFIRIRDITYLLMVIAFIVVGVGIMLRVQIDPRTVMSIQNQIPKLIVGIILITFSYSIAGLLFDATWMMTYFGINTITADSACGNPNGNSLTRVATTNLLNIPPSYVSDLFSDAGCHGSFDGISGMAWKVSLTLTDILARFIEYMLGFGAVSVTNDTDSQTPEACNGFLGLFGGDFSECFKYGVFYVIKWALGALFFVILFISIIISLFKVWFMLLKAYISILIAIILAPLWIILGVIPGGGLGFGQWMRHMVSHLAIFPAAALMFTLASVIAGNPAANDPNSSYLPPLIGNPNIGDNIGILTAMGFIFLTPDLLNLIRDALKTPPGKYTGNIFGRAKSANPTSSITAIGGFGYSLGGISNLTGKIPFLNKADKK